MGCTDRSHEGCARSDLGCHLDHPGPLTPEFYNSGTVLLAAGCLGGGLAPRLVDGVVAGLGLGRSTAAEGTLRVYLKHVVSLKVEVGGDAHVGALAIPLVLLVLFVGAGGHRGEVSFVSGADGLGKVASCTHSGLHDVVSSGNSGTRSVGVEINISQALGGAHAVGRSVDGIDKVGVTACQASKLLLRFAVNLGGVQGGDAAQLVSGLARELAASDSGNVGSGAGSDKVDDLLWHVDSVGQFHEAVANDLADPLDVQSYVLLEVLDGIAQLDHDQVSGLGIILVIVLLPALLLLLFGGVGVGTRVGLEVVALLVRLDQFAGGLLHLGRALRQTLDEDGHLVVTEVLLPFHSLDEVV